MKTTVLITFVCLTYFIGNAQPNDFSSIVRIVAPNEYGENDIGTGILVGNDNSHIYIATANHVVTAANEAKVFFYNQTIAQTATIIQKDEKMDVAVLKMKLPNGIPFPHLLPADPKILEVQKKVLSIGHPMGSFWKSNYQNIIQEVSIYNQPGIMSITPQGIVPGCSGSIVLTFEGIWLGMITEVNSVEAKCVKVGALVDLLNKWNIPINLTIPKEPELIQIKGNVYKDKKLKDFSIGKYEVSYEDFRLFIASTGYITDAEKQGYSLTYYSHLEWTINIMTLASIIKSDSYSESAVISDEFELSNPKFLNQVDWKHNEVGLLRDKSTFKDPIVHISFNDAQAYCQWLSKLHNANYCLPTITQWLFTASDLGKKNKLQYDEVEQYSNLRDASFCEKTGWTDCPDYSDGYPTLAPVNSFSHDKLGIFQIHGNVSEWCYSPEKNIYALGKNYQRLRSNSKKDISFNHEKIRMDDYSDPFGSYNEDYRSSLIGFRIVKNEKVELANQKLNNRTLVEGEKGSFNYHGRNYNWKRLKDGRKWMTENLNYEIQNSSCNSLKSGSSDQDCENYGRKYTWDAAKKACPKGWRLPSDKEWRTMISFYGGCDEDAQGNGKIAFNALIESGDSGFNAVLGGSSFESANEPNSGYYWTSTEGVINHAFGYMFNKPFEYIYRHTELNKKRELFCRCIEGVLDTDNDGLADQEDLCVDVFGDLINGGCPLTKDVTTGNFKDKRDGQSYSWVKLKDGKKWMRQNLNFKIENSWMYNNDPSNAKKIGRLYNWDAAQKACPKGWHLPSEEEWASMLKQFSEYRSHAGTSTINSGEDLIQGGKSGLSITFGGKRNLNGDFESFLSKGYFWSSSQIESNQIRGFSLSNYRINKYNYKKEFGLSCRCVQDDN